MPDLILDDQHRYWVGKGRLQGVTSILKALNLTNYNAAWYTDEARDKGSNLHQCCALIDEDDLVWDSVDPIIIKEVEAYAEWKELTGFNALIIETPMHSELMSYAGTPDVFGQFSSGQYAVVDRKRGVPDKAVKYQLALYVLLIVEYLAAIPDLCGRILNFNIDRFALGSIGTGKPKMLNYTDRADYAIAQSIVGVYNAGLNDGIYKLDNERGNNGNGTA